MAKGSDGSSEVAQVKKEIAEAKKEVAELRGGNIELMKKLTGVADQLIEQKKQQRDALAELVNNPAAVAYERSDDAKAADATVSRLEAEVAMAREKFAEVAAETSSVAEQLANLTARTWTADDVATDHNLRMHLKTLEARSGEAGAALEVAQKAADKARFDAATAAVNDLHRHLALDADDLARSALLLLRAWFAPRLANHRALVMQEFAVRQRLGSDKTGIPTAMHTHFTEAEDLVQGQQRRAGLYEAVGLALANHDIQARWIAEQANDIEAAAIRADRAARGEPDRMGPLPARAGTGGTGPVRQSWDYDPYANPKR